MEDVVIVEMGRPGKKKGFAQNIQDRLLISK